MTRGLAAIAVAMAVSIAAPAVATAATRYAEPGGDLLGACPREDPCDIFRAVNNASAGDEVIILPGDYGSAAAPLVGQVGSLATGLNVHGEDGKPRPRIFLDTNNDTSGFRLTGPGTTARHLEVHHHASRPRHRRRGPSRSR